MPTHFSNGPAQGQNLMLRRAPKFLRVTEKAGKWDALDRLDDSPQPGETLHAYQLVGGAGVCHIKMSGKGSGFYTIATYAVCVEQPPQETMTTRCAWQEWCRAEYKKQKAPPIAGEASKPPSDLFP